MKEFKKFPTHIVLHTAAFRGEANAELITQWHLENGWDDIGYHYVITGSMFDKKSKIESGRPLHYHGAHARFFNHKSIGVCVTGHGDHMEWTQAQIDNLSKLVSDLMDAYQIPLKKVIGHRDTPWEKLKRNKTCPGNLIDMNEIRKFILQYRQGKAINEEVKN